MFGAGNRLKDLQAAIETLNEWGVARLVWHEYLSSLHVAELDPNGLEVIAALFYQLLWRRRGSIRAPAVVQFAHHHAGDLPPLHHVQDGRHVDFALAQRTVAQ